MYATLSVAQPFRFLDLPRELRLDVYDFLPITIRHHTIRIDKCHDQATIISKRIQGALVLLTCRTIFRVATILRQNIQALSMEPVRLSVNLVSLGGLPVEAILLYISGYNTGPAHYHRATWMGDTHTFVSSRQNLASLLRYNTPHPTCQVEVAIVCAGDSPLAHAQSAARVFFWLVHVNEQEGSLPKQLNVSLRPRITSDRVAALFKDTQVLGEDRVSWLWKYSQGRRLSEQEWDEQWKEGERC